jgi:hypothetical protein
MTWQSPDINVLSTQTSGTLVTDYHLNENLVSSSEEESQFISDAGGTGATGAASNDENRPPFYNVVWIMRIK